jgi:hypothetical protein
MTIAAKTGAAALTAVAVVAGIGPLCASIVIRKGHQ